MHIISKTKLRNFWTAHRDAEQALGNWHRVALKAARESWAEVRQAFPKASYYRCCLVFNVCGNKYRLVVRCALNWKTLFVVGVYPHAEYDLGHWKDFCTCR